MLIVFPYIQGIVHKQFVPPGQTVKASVAVRVPSGLGGHSAQTPKQGEEKQLHSPP
jgi:hypothetical protein